MTLRSSNNIDLARESAPEATTLLKFRHLLEAQQQFRPCRQRVGAMRDEAGSVPVERARYHYLISNRSDSEAIYVGTVTIK